MKTKWIFAIALVTGLTAAVAIHHLVTQIAGSVGQLIGLL